MDLMLHPQKKTNETSSHYKRAFKNATELFVVSAYLTEWDEQLTLNPKCRDFQIIVGKDFGITRIAACKAVLKWLTATRKDQFLVADQISGFHPKMVFWKEATGHSFAIVGSSNLTKAAFETNYEANAYYELTKAQYANARQWLRRIEKLSVGVSGDWLDQYTEAPSTPKGRAKGSKKGKPLGGVPVVAFSLPRPKGMDAHIAERRKQLRSFQKKRSGLETLFRRCAKGKIKPLAFYEQLPNYWSWEIGDRIQGRGFEILGKRSNFRALSKSYVAIVDASDDERDACVVREIDKLKEQDVSSRGAFLSEMLCLRFPTMYPILNAPVQKFLRVSKFRAPRGASEGVRYLDLARKLRASLLQNPDHPAKNLVELDAVIWRKYGTKK